MSDDSRQSGTWHRRFRAEEVSGIAFAFKARALAVGAVALWCLASVPDLARLIPYLLTCAVIVGIGLMVYLARHSRFVVAIQLVSIVLDVVLLIAILLYPGDKDPAAWMGQAWVRRGFFLYMVTYVALSALSYSPQVVLFSGAVALAGLVYVHFHVIALLPGGEPELRAMLVPHGNTPIAFLAHQLVMLAIVTGLIAAAVWRARRHVERVVSVEGQRANLARFFSPNIVDRLAATERPFESGRAQTAAVLFVDIVGFTRLFEGLPPERTVALLRAFHKRMARCVFDNGGTLDKFIGDGLMATFGTPEPHVDDERRATACALDMVDTVAAWNVQRVARGFPPVDVAVGVHVGPVLLGTIGTPERLEFTAMGDTVNTASRLEEATRQHDAAVIVSAEVLAGARRAGLPAEALARFVDIGALAIPGHIEPIRAWALPREPEHARAAQSEYPAVFEGT